MSPRSYTIQILSYVSYLCNHSPNNEQLKIYCKPDLVRLYLIKQLFEFYRMQSFNITSAKAHLSSLLKKVEDKNEEFIIERAGKPIAKVIKYTPLKSIDRLGRFRGIIKVSQDFDEWPAELAISLGLK